MDNKLVIIKAEKLDVGEIAELVYNFCQQTEVWADYQYHEICKEFGVMFENRYELEGHDYIQPVCYIAYWNDEIVGMINFRQSYIAWNVFDIGWCIVDPKFQKSFLSVGYKLGQKVISEIKTMRPDGGIIQTAANSDAYPLLEKYGFFPGVSFDNVGVHSKILYYKF